MAKDKSSQLTADGDYLDGTIEDGVTEVDKAFYNDIVQFFVKLMDKSELSWNDNFDNETNGYQLIEALEYVLVTRTPETITDCDEADRTGFYTGTSAANMPPGTSGDFVLINMIKGTPYQIIYTGLGVYFRYFSIPLFTDWTPLGVKSTPETQFIGATAADDIPLGTGITVASAPNTIVNYVSVDGKGNVELSLQVTRDNDTRDLICTLPSQFRPAYQVVTNTYIYGGGADPGQITVNTNGTVVISTGDLYLNIAAKVRYSV